MLAQLRLEFFDLLLSGEPGVTIYAVRNAKSCKNPRACHVFSIDCILFTQISLYGTAWTPPIKSEFCTNTMWIMWTFLEPLPKLSPNQTRVQHIAMFHFISYRIVLRPPGPREFVVEARLRLPEYKANGHGVAFFHRNIWIFHLKISMSHEKASLFIRNHISNLFFADMSRWNRSLSRIMYNWWSFFAWPLENSQAIQRAKVPSGLIKGAKFLLQRCIYFVNDVRNKNPTRCSIKSIPKIGERISWAPCSQRLWFLDLKC